MCPVITHKKCPRKQTDSRRNTRSALSEDRRLPPLPISMQPPCFFSLGASPPTRSWRSHIRSPRRRASPRRQSGRRAISARTPNRDHVTDPHRLPLVTRLPENAPGQQRNATKAGRGGERLEKRGYKHTRQKEANVMQPTAALLNGPLSQKGPPPPPSTLYISNSLAAPHTQGLLLVARPLSISCCKTLALSS